MPKERYVSPKESQEIIVNLRLILEYKKRISRVKYWLDKAPNQPTKFRT